MSKTILSYPDGVAGIALLLMRLSSGLVTWPVLSRLLESNGSWAGLLAALLLGAALVSGAFTRLAALLLAAALAALLVGASPEAMLALLACAGNVTALALLGPGAFSVDAKWYGRRVIKLVGRSPDRGGPD
jgi:putative oxidoreductase